MKQFWLRGLQWVAVIERRYDLPGLTLLTITLMTLGIFSLTRNPLLVALLLVIPICLLAGVRGWGAGILVSLVALLLIAPFVGLVNPGFTMTTWELVALGYFALSLAVGINGARLRRMQAFRLASLQASLEQTGVEANEYTAVFEEMKGAHQRLQRMNAELELLNTIATTVNGTLDVSRVQISAMANIGNLMDVDEVQIFEYDDISNLFTLLASRPMLFEEISQKVITLPATEGVFDRVLQVPHGTLVHLAADEIYLCPSTMHIHEVKSLLAVPLRSRGRVFGVMMLGRHSDKPFVDDDLTFMESVGRVLTVAIENARLFEQVQELSLSDELTSLANRRMFNLRLTSELARIRDDRSGICLVMFDLDFFKRVNDEFGHPAGDQVLQQFARRVKLDVRQADLLCRLGGEEFALICSDTTLAVATSIAERICRRIAQTPFLLDDGTAIAITVSAGVAGSRIDLNTAESLVEAADHALYTAKTNGRNRVEVFAELPVPAPIPVA
jgi:diguanylate cyclase (GGDEF)-like protein